MPLSNNDCEAVSDAGNALEQDDWNPVANFASDEPELCVSALEVRRAAISALASIITSRFGPSKFRPNSLGLRWIRKLDIWQEASRHFLKQQVLSFPVFTAVLKLKSVGCRRFARAFRMLMFPCQQLKRSYKG